jgi:membrane protein
MVRRFVDDGCLQSAGALAYTSLFALVPLTAATLGILSGFPAFVQWRDRITSFVFANFIPTTGDVVRQYLTQFADNASKATAVGIAVLLFSALMLMLSVEDAFNRIWRVPRSRAAGARFVLYWAVLTLGPLLLIVALVLSSQLFSLPLFEAAESEFPLKARLLDVSPFLIEWFALTAAYVLIPNRSVRLRDGAAGALLAALLFEIAKRAFATYVTTGANYQEVYGALAIVPIFILWIYLSWILVLLGASLTASLAAFDYRPPQARLAEGEEFNGLVRILAHFADAQRAGIGMHGETLREREPFLTDDMVQRYIGDLSRADMIQRNEMGEWILTRDLASVSLYDIYSASGYRLPLADSLPPGLSAGRDAGAAVLIGRASAGLQNVMNVPLSEIFPVPVRSKAVTASPAAIQEKPA